MICDILEKISQHQEQAQAFFDSYYQQLTPLPFISCDIRSSGDKIAIIDTNLFPGGFNNLCNAFTQKISQEVSNYFSKYFPQAKHIALLTEEHTRNQRYLDNVQRLKLILESANFQVSVCVINELDFINSGATTKIRLNESYPDLILSNNDFSSDYPEELLNSSTPILAHPLLGWRHRKKSKHFELLSKLLNEFAGVIDVDPSLLQARFLSHEETDLKDSTHLHSLETKVQQLFENCQKDYQKLSIDKPPYIYIKNDSGTYGMGIHVIHSAEEIQGFNKKIRNKLLSSKGGNSVSSFLIQEGIPTSDFYEERPIEPVIYSVGFQPIGGFFRINELKDHLGNLNAKGMSFSCLCLHKLDEPHENSRLRCEEKQFLVQLSFILTQIAAIAVAQEWEQSQA